MPIKTLMDDSPHELPASVVKVTVAASLTRGTRSGTPVGVVTLLTRQGVHRARRRTVVTVNDTITFR